MKKKRKNTELPNSVKGRSLIKQTSFNNYGTSTMIFILFLYRLCTNILSFLLIQLPLQLIGALVLLPVCYFYDIGEFPRVFRWFDSADPYIGRDVSVINHVSSLGWTSKYVWTAFRNPTNYFCYRYLGFDFTGKEGYNITGSLDVGDSTGKHEGLKIIELTTGYYEYLYVKKIKDNSCIYLRMGWKISNMNNKPGSYCQQVFTISYRSYSGV